MAIIDVDEFKELRDELNKFIEHCEQINANIDERVKELEKQGHNREEIIDSISIVYGDY